MIRLALAALLFLVAGCADRAAVVDDGVALDQRVFVTSNDWHTQIVVASSDLPEGALPEAADFQGVSWLAVGWGEHEYYPMPDPPFSLALKAALLPSPAVVQLVPMAEAPRSGPGFEVLEIALSEAALDALLAALDDGVARGGRPRAPVVAPGLDTDGRFYPAEGTFHLFNTCNTWVADKLATAGLPVRVWGVIRAEALMRQLRDLPMVSPAVG